MAKQVQACTRLNKDRGAFFPKWLQNFYFALVTSVKSSYKTEQNGVCLSCVRCCSAEIIDQEICPPVWAFNRVHACAYLAIVISSLKQVMTLKQAPFYSF